MKKRDNQRALKVIRSLRSRRDKQGCQIDILCRDMVSAHQQFSLKLANLTFSAAFYEAILSCSDLEHLLDTATDAIRNQISEAGAGIFLLDAHGFDVYIADAGLADQIEKSHFQSWFTRDLVDDISRTSRVCSLEHLLRMGLQGPPAILKTISAAAVPLGRMGEGIGFIWVYRPAHLPLTKEELSQVAGISTGLRVAIQSFQTAKNPSSEKSGFSL